MFIVCHSLSSIINITFITSFRFFLHSIGHITIAFTNISSFTLFHLSIPFFLVTLHTPSTHWFCIFLLHDLNPLTTFQNFFTTFFLCSLVSILNILINLPSLFIGSFTAIIFNSTLSIVTLWFVVYYA